MTFAEIQQLPREEKFQLLEALWEDLSRDQDSIESPAWHGEALLATEIMVKEGKAKFYDLDESIRRIRQKISRDP